MELKLILLLLPAALLVELTIQEDQRAGAPKARQTSQVYCGRDFVRAIVNACGGSKWKREAMDPAVPELVQTEVLESDQLQSNSDPELKQPQGDGPVDGGPSWSDFLEYYLADQRKIPEDDENLENDKSVKEYLRDHPSDSEPSWGDFLDLYGDDLMDIAGGADDESRDANTTGSDAPQIKVKRKRNSNSELHVKCCIEGCTTDEIANGFC